MLARADTKVRGRFCVNRFGPLHRRVQTASAVLRNFVRQLEKTFSTVSVKIGKAPCEHMFSAKIVSGSACFTCASHQVTARRRSGVGVEAAITGWLMLLPKDCAELSGRCNNKVPEVDGNEFH